MKLGGGSDDDMVIATLRWRHDAHDRWMMFRMMFMMMFMMTFTMMFTMMLMMIWMTIFMMTNAAAAASPVTLSRNLWED